MGDAEFAVGIFFNDGRIALGACRAYPFEAKITGGESNQFIERGE